MTDLCDITEQRTVGIEVDVGNGPVRPVWREIRIRIPDGEIAANEWNSMTFDEKTMFLNGDDNEN